MKYSSRNSPIENSVNNYNQICMMSILCTEYIAKGFISRNGKIAVKSSMGILKILLAVATDTDGNRSVLTVIMTLDSITKYFCVK